MTKPGYPIEQNQPSYDRRGAQAALIVAWAFFGVGRLIQKLDSNGLLDIDDYIT